MSFLIRRLLVRLIILFFLNPAAATFYLRFAEVPFLIALMIILLITSLSMVFIYYLWGTLTAFAMKWAWTLLVWKIKNYFDRVTWDDDIIDALHLNDLLARAKKEHHSILFHVTTWIAKQHLLIILLILCIPFIPFLPTAGIIALKNAKGRGKTAILIGTNFLRTTLMVLGIYGIGQLPKL